MTVRDDVIDALGRRWFVVLLVAVFVFCGIGNPLWAQENEDCLMCHEDPDLVGEKGGEEFPVFVDPVLFAASVHSGFGCIDCHGDLDGAELPHEDELEPVDCAMCHDDVGEELEAGPHGKWADDPLSPAAGCISCHGTHDVLSPSDPNASVSSSKSEKLCGRCHARELRQVAKSPHAGNDSEGPAARAA